MLRIRAVLLLLGPTTLVGCQALSGVDDLHLKTNADASAPETGDAGGDGGSGGSGGMDGPSSAGGVAGVAPMAGGNVGTGGGTTNMDAGAGGADGLPAAGAACPEAGKLACNGTQSDTRLVCDGKTQRWTPNGTCPSGQLCDTTDGTCKSIVSGCEGQKAGAATCDGAIRRVCGPDLVTSTSTTCDSAALCLLGTGPNCAVCKDGDHDCAGAVLKTCNATHQGFDVQETCATVALCNDAAGACTSAFCLPDQYHCEGDKLEKCNAAQDGFDPVTTCAAGFCDENGKQCDKCVPGATSCVDGKMATCAADGQSQTSAACPATTSHCIGAGRCVECVTATDCPAPNNPCLTASCSANSCGTSPRTGVSCTLPNATAQCGANGACTVTSCSGGFADCSASAGCETDTRTDSANCGRCGHACPGSTCTNGLCDPIQIGALQDGGSAGVSIAVAGQSVYWAVGRNNVGGGIFRCSLSSCGTLTDFTGITDSPNEFVIDTRQIYWVDLNAGVLSCPLSGCGGTPTTVSGPMASSGNPNQGPLGGLARDASSNLYWTDANSKTVRRYNPTLPGSATQVIANTKSFATSITVDGSTLYWLEGSSGGSGGVATADGAVMKCSTSCADNAAAVASNRQIAVALFNNENSITASTGRLYWYEMVDFNKPTVNVLMCPTTGCGSGPTQFASGGSLLGGLYADGTHLYYAGDSGGAHWVMRRKLDASAPAEKFAQAAGTVMAVTSDATMVYWLETTTILETAGPHYVMKAPK